MKKEIYEIKTDCENGTQSEIVSKSDTETKKNSFWQKASIISKKVATGVQKGAHALSEKAKNDSYLRKMKKYSPLFPEQYESESFNLPNMIMIVDDAVRRDIDVCEGAIGWLDNESGMEILYLYDEAIEMSKIRFIPAPVCDAIYFVDPYDRNRFIRVDCFFSKAHEEKLAELEHIAYSLGAKSCSIEIVETDASFKSDNRKHSAKGFLGKHGSTENAERSMSSTSASRRSGRIVSYFEGSNQPKTPALKWFAHDDTVRGLIEMRCTDKNAIKTKTLELSGASSASMSLKTARSIDTAVSKISSKANFSMEKKATSENSSTLIYEIEF